MTIEEIRQIVELVRDSGVGELEVHWGENSVKVRSATGVNRDAMVSAVIPVPVAAPAIVAQAPPATPAPPATTPAQAPNEDGNNIVIKSPIVGTYYDAPSPGADPFVRVGDRVEPKEVLCIIESMKLMNEIEAEAAGIIVAKHVENGRPVEYGESLFTIRPL